MPLIQDFLNNEDYSGQGCLEDVKALCELFPIMLRETLTKYNIKEIGQLNDLPVKNLSI